MITRTSPKTLMASAAILVGWMWLTAAQCSDISGPKPQIQGCSVSYDTDFPLGGTVSLNKPAQCPVKLGGVTRIPYAAHADLPAGSVFYDNPWYQASLVNMNGQVTALFNSAVWSQGTNGGNPRYFVDITGDVYLATGGFDANDAGYDDIQNRFNKGNWTTATTRVTYSFGASFNILTAPDAVDAGTSFTVSATTNDPLLVSPLTWSWYEDGVLAGTTSVNEFTMQGGAPGSTKEIEGRATDSYGHSVSGRTWVYARTQCVDEYGNPVINCQ